MAIPPRGVRNNNPGNIDFNPRNKWDGQVGMETGVSNPRFAKFSAPEYGIRAICKLIRNYRGKPGTPNVGAEGIDTVQEIINRWAPSNENDTKAYANAVAKKLGVTPQTSIDVTDPKVMFPLVSAIIVHENGYQPYTDEVIERGVALAG